jgi:hypothetical protein
MDQALRASEEDLRTSARLRALEVVLMEKSVYIEQLERAQDAPEPAGPEVQLQLQEMRQEQRDHAQQVDERLQRAEQVVADASMQAKEDAEERERVLQQAQDADNHKFQLETQLKELRSDFDRTIGERQADSALLIQLRVALNQAEAKNNELIHALDQGNQQQRTRAAPKVTRGKVEIEGSRSHSSDSCRCAVEKNKILMGLEEERIRHEQEKHLLQIDKTRALEAAKVLRHHSEKVEAKFREQQRRAEKLRKEMVGLEGELNEERARREMLERMVEGDKRRRKEQEEKQRREQMVRLDQMMKGGVGRSREGVVSRSAEGGAADPQQGGTEQEQQRFGELPTVARVVPAPSPGPSTTSPVPLPAPSPPAPGPSPALSPAPSRIPLSVPIPPRPPPPPTLQPQVTRTPPPVVSTDPYSQTLDRLSRSLPLRPSSRYLTSAPRAGVRDSIDVSQNLRELLFEQQNLPEHELVASLDRGHAVWMESIRDQLLVPLVPRP